MIHEKKCILLVEDDAGYEFSFTTVVDTRNLKEMQDRGIEIYLLENSVPVWAVNMGLTYLWCFIQDIINFKNPLK